MSVWYPALGSSASGVAASEKSRRVRETHFTGHGDNKAARTARAKADAAGFDEFLNCNGPFGWFHDIWRNWVRHRITG